MVARNRCAKDGWVYGEWYGWNSDRICVGSVETDGSVWFAALCNNYALGRFYVANQIAIHSYIYRLCSLKVLLDVDSTITTHYEYACILYCILFLHQPFEFHALFLVKKQVITYLYASLFGLNNYYVLWFIMMHEFVGILWLYIAI